MAAPLNSLNSRTVEFDSAFKELENLLLYLRNIDWYDPFILSLIFFHLAVTLLVSLTRNNSNLQTLLFLSLLSLVYFSEVINDYASKNWRFFSRNNYFDTNGNFISIVFSTPILLNCMALVATWLCQSAQLMMQLKRAQLQKKAEDNKPTKRNLKD